MPSSKLTAILTNLVQQAGEHPTTSQSITLSHGLTIAVRSQWPKTTLALSRINSYPSDQEWDTVVRAWPYPLNGVIPDRHQSGSRFFLIARWSIRNQGVIL